MSDRIPANQAMLNAMFSVHRETLDEQARIELYQDEERDDLDSRQACERASLIFRQEEEKLALLDDFFKRAVPQRFSLPPKEDPDA